jgi:hypothetical protein
MRDSHTRYTDWEYNHVTSRGKKQDWQHWRNPIKWQTGFERDVAAITALLDGLINAFEFNISLYVRPKFTHTRDKFEDTVNGSTQILYITSDVIRNQENPFQNGYKTVASWGAGMILVYPSLWKFWLCAVYVTVNVRIGYTLFSCCCCICMPTKNRKVIYASRNIWNPINWLVYCVGSSFIHHYSHVTSHMEV